jgi:hypothetical protein
MVVQGAVTTVVVVVGEIGTEGPSPPAGATEGGGVRPFGEQGADETFRFAIGLGAIGLGKALADPEVQGGDGNGGGAVGAAVVSQEALHDDALRRVPGHGAPQEAGRGGAGFVGEHLGVGEPGVVVDGHVDVLPADAPLAAAPIPVHAMADAADPPQLLDVEVDEVPRLGALVAHDRSRRLQRPEPIQPLPPKLGDHRGDGVRGVLGDPATAPALAAALEDLAPTNARQAVRRALGPRGAVLQRRPGVSGHGRPIRRLGPAEPLVDRLARDAHATGDLRDGDPRLDARDTRGSRQGGYPCQLVGVHGRSDGCEGVSRQPQLAAIIPCEQPPRSLHLALRFAFFSDWRDSVSLPRVGKGGRQAAAARPCDNPQSARALHLRTHMVLMKPREVLKERP